MEQSPDALGKLIPITRNLSKLKKVSITPGKRDLALDQDFDSLANLFDFFKDEKACMDFLELVRWADGPVCPYCAHKDKIYRTVKGFKCNHCGKKFTVLKSTLFENTKLPLRSWFIALYLCACDSHGINSSQLARYLNITQKSTWFMLHRIREIFKTPGSKLFGIVEADETYIGGRVKNKHAKGKKKNTQGRSLADKVPVLGMVERDGRVVAQAVKNVKLLTLKAIITDTVGEGSMLITDELSSYNFAKNNYYHVAMKHNKEQYVNDEFHTNTIEGFWGMLKRGISGTFSHVSKGYLQRYLDEFAFRYNNRKLSASKRFILILEQACFYYLPFKKMKEDAQAQVASLTQELEKAA